MKIASRSTLAGQPQDQQHGKAVQVHHCRGVLNWLHICDLLGRSEARRCCPSTDAFLESACFGDDDNPIE